MTLVPIYTCYNELPVLGMMSKNNIILPASSGKELFWVIRKSNNKVMFLPKVPLNDGNNNLFVDFFKSVIAQGFLPYTKLSFGYLNQEMMDILSKVYLDHTGKKFPKSKTMKLTAVQSNFDKPDLVFGENSLVGKEYRELRETRNKFQNKIKAGKIVLYTNPFMETYLAEIKPLIEPFLKIWDENEGKKYGWQRHSGYDKSFFTETRYETSMSNLQSNFLVDRETSSLIGYSIISSHPTNDQTCFPYVIRKCNTHYSRNITMFLDYLSAKAIHELNTGKPFSIHWGASSGGVLKYKLSAFPKANTAPAYFATLPTP